MVSQTTLLVNNQLRSIYNDCIGTVSQEDDVFCKEVLEWISLLVGDESTYLTKPSSLPNVSFWIDYIKTHGYDDKSLLYRHYLFDKIFTLPVLNEVNNPLLKEVMNFMVLGNNEYFPLDDATVWFKISQDDAIVNQMRKLNLEIKVYGNNLTNRLDVSDHHIQRAHGCLSSHGLIYSLYLICVSLSFKTKTLKTKSSEDLLMNITHTLTNLKGVLFHVTD